MDDRVEHLRDLSRRYHEQKRFVEAAWLRFYAMAPGDLCSEHYEFARAMYFAGVVSMFDTIKLLSNKEQPAERVQAFLQTVGAELNEHVNATVPTEGNA